MGKNDTNVALVVPSIRENCFRDFVERWAPMGLFGDVHLILVEDNPCPTFDAERLIQPYKHSGFTHLSWHDIEEDLGKNSWIIPRRSDTVRSYGYVVAYDLGFEHVLTLDDDCYPLTPDDPSYGMGRGLVADHLHFLNSRTRWYNTLNSVKPRGIPFYNRGKNDRIVVNHGLWTNVLDYDAPYQLANPVPEKFSLDNQVVPAGYYFPMCGMNVMWRAEVTVLMYHLLMGQWASEIHREGPHQMIDSNGTTQPVLNKLPFDRFGDIWCGIFMKKICDAYGLQVSTGTPYIRHERASNPFTNLRKEANGIEVNEKLWEYVDRLEIDRSRSLACSYADLGAHIRGFSEYPEHGEYFKNLGDAMQIWAGLFV